MYFTMIVLAHIYEENNIQYTCLCIYEVCSKSIQAPPAKNNAMPVKWFWQIVRSQLLPIYKKFQTDSWCHSLFLKQLVQSYSALSLVFCLQV